jgi:hypothetical protein
MSSPIAGRRQMYLIPGRFLRPSSPGHHKNIFFFCSVQDRLVDGMMEQLK